MDPLTHQWMAGCKRRRMPSISNGLLGMKQNSVPDELAMAYPELTRIDRTNKVPQGHADCNRLAAFAAGVPPTSDKKRVN
jgi:hypothetical protein